jgi:NACalpha-BTF3-like transcription factor
MSQINKEDVDVIALEAEVDKKAAERRLREHGGDLAAALKSYL